MAQTAADVDIFISDNATFQDAFQFVPPVGGTLSLTGMTFEMSVKASNDDVTPLVTFTSPTQITVVDVVACTIHMNVADTVIQTSLPAAEYTYDLIMYDGSIPPIRTQMMYGNLFVSHGVTET